MTRKAFDGGTLATTLSGSINASVTTVVVANGDTYPSSANPFVIAVDRGKFNEEKMLITSRSGNTFTVSQRGYDGTAASTHDDQATVEHVLDALTVDEANAFVNTLTTNGDLLTYSTGSPTRIALGSSGLPLVAGSGAPSYAQLGAAGIADASVTNGKLAANAVQTANITDLSVTSAKLADTAVTTAKITDLNVTTGKLADNAVTTAKITNANVTTVKLADLNVTTAKLADSAVTSAKIADGTIVSADIASATIVDGNIASATITGAKIANTTITDANIASSTITGGKIAATTITNSNIANATLTAGKVADEAFGTFTPISSGINLGTSGGAQHGRYHKVGNVVFFHIDITLGTGFSFAAPIVLITPTATFAGSGAWQHVYNVQFVDVSSPAAWFPGQTRYASASSFSVGAIQVFGQPYVDFAVTSTMPFTFAASDRIFVSGWYEEA